MSAKQTINSHESLLYVFDYDDARNYKVAFLIAVVFHMVLVMATLPEGNSKIKEVIKPKKRMTAVELIPPEKPLDPPVIINEQIRKVPIPDPTPDEPEPLIDLPSMNEIDDIPDDFIRGIPEVMEPPYVDRPVNLDTEGLIKPVYSLAQLQSNAVYPELGKTIRKTGFVILSVVLKKDGTVGEVKFLGGLDNFGFPESAIRAARKLAFEPGYLNGRPVDVVLNLTIHYRFN